VLSPGDRFEGYVVDGIVGRGGSGTVYRAHESASPDRTVALKVLSDERRGPEEQARLRREFEFARRLQHPHIVQVFESGPVWLSMEFVAGGTITGLATVPNRIAALGQIADALDFIHGQGVAHCDVKPANILVSQCFYQQGARLMDFGSALHIGDESVPRASHVSASLPWCAPELLMGNSPTGATDVYSLACTAVEMISGSPPFTANTQVGLMQAQLHSPAPRISRRIDWLPRAFDSVLAKAMAKEPQDRYQSCSELTALITRVIRD
jgi:serine/threonine-protein kinase